MRKQLPAAKAGAHLAYMADEAADKASMLDHAFTEAGKYPLLLSVASKHGWNSRVGKFLLFTLFYYTYLIHTEIFFKFRQY